MKTTVNMKTMRYIISVLIAIVVIPVSAANAETWGELQDLDWQSVSTMYVGAPIINNSVNIGSDAPEYSWESTSPMLDADAAPVVSVPFSGASSGPRRVGGGGGIGNPGTMPETPIGSEWMMIVFALLYGVIIVSKTCLFE